MVADSVVRRVIDAFIGVLLFAGVALLVVPSLVLPSRAWTPEEMLTVRIDEPFVVPEAGRYAIFDGTESKDLIALDSFARSPTLLSSEDILLTRPQDGQSVDTFRFEVDGVMNPTAENPVVGDFGVYGEEQLWFTVPPENAEAVGYLLGPIEVDELVFDIQKMRHERLQDRLRLAFFGLLCLLVAGAVFAVARFLDLRSTPSDA